MNLLDIEEVMKQTKLNENEIRDLQQKELFPAPFDEVAKEMLWSQNDIRIWIKNENRNR